MIDNSGEILRTYNKDNYTHRAEASGINITASFESHADLLFLQIMELDGITPQDVKNSLSLEANRDMIFNAGESTGMSGSFFFFSHDNRFIIKTLNRGEGKLLLSILDEMIAHFVSCENKSLIAKIYGLFTINTDVFHGLDVIVMQNTARMQDSANNKVTFDLKGSSVNRRT